MYGKIKTCKKYTVFDGLTIGYRLHCSNKCASSDPEVKNKFKDIFLKKYGVTNPSKLDSVKRKKEDTCIRNYGVKHPGESSDLKIRIKDTRRKNFLPVMKKFLEENNLKLIDEYKNAASIHTFKCLKCDTEFKSSWANLSQGWGKCPSCYHRNNGCSAQEIELGNWVESLGLKIVRKDKSIGIEIDIYIPDLKIGIEYNGTWFHSKDFMDLHEKIKDDPKTKQLIKTEICTEKDIQLIHIFEDEWVIKDRNIKEILQKILLEGYSLLDNECDMITLNRRFSKNPKYYQKLGYEVIIIEPRLYYNKRKYKIWNVGYLQLKKSIGTLCCNKKVPA